MQTRAQSYLSHASLSGRLGLGALASVFVFFIGALLTLAVAASHQLSAEEMQQRLKNVQDSAQNLDYAGIITYNNGEEVQSMYLIHLVDGKGERERLVMLDGPEREFLRHNQVTQCLLPEQQSVILEPSRSDRFPGLLLWESAEIAQSYHMYQESGMARVAGRQCQPYQLRPIDDLRFGYRLCIDEETSLLLQMQTLDQQKQPLFQVSFASVDVGSEVDPGRLDSPWDYEDWKVISAAMHEVDLSQLGWRIPYPDGFVPVQQVVRSMPQSREVAQLVLSDGLAAISIFIEPVAGQGQRLAAEEGKKKGPVFLHRVQIGENWLTLTGEVPLETLQYLGQHTQFVPPSHNN